MNCQLFGEDHSSCKYKVWTSSFFAIHSASEVLAFMVWIEMDLSCPSPSVLAFPFVAFKQVPQKVKLLFPGPFGQARVR